ncbi:MAG: hypothetical protein ACRDPA_10905 [Solirubrobacteraceae bacterium]
MANEAELTGSRRDGELMRLKIGVLVATVITGLVFTSSAFAYWFFQGNLPLSDGTRTVLLGSNPNTPVYVRESWSSCSHSMKYIFVETGGSWDGGTFDYSNGCDQHIMVQYPESFDNYGCQNPDGDSTVYDNCYAGTNW